MAVKAGDIVRITECGIDYATIFFMQVTSSASGGNKIYVIGKGITAWLWEGVPRKIEINDSIKILVHSEQIEKLKTMASVKKMIIIDIFRYNPKIVID